MPRGRKKPEEILSQIESENETELDVSEKEPSDEGTNTTEISLSKTEEDVEGKAEEKDEEEKEAKDSDESEAEAEVVAEEEVKKPRRRRSPRKKAEEVQIAAADALPENIKKDLEVVATGVKQTMDSMAKQWAAVKDISVGVTAQLERINQLLKEIPNNQVLKPQVKPSFITKVAVGMSAFATLLGVISVSLSQTARDRAIEQVASVPGYSAAAPRNQDLSSALNAPEIASRPGALNGMPLRRKAIETSRKR